jgi:para-nitrobenzyl esterase
MSTDRRAVLAGAAAASLAGLASTAKAAAKGPIAVTRYGKVRGAEVDGIKVFKGVRYGADTAPRRFMPALPPRPWTGVVDALAYGPASPQLKTAEAVSEDCLFLNVWTPGADAGKRAVMVYIHGGAYSNGSGSSPSTDGTKLARRSDVVVVSMNHRLNVFGYAWLKRLAPGFDVSGNAGQLDLILALQWVRDNIAAFGGDPDRVMVFGQSGGGAKIATLMATPAAEGLFHRAATMSGQHVTASGPSTPPIRARALIAAHGPDVPSARSTCCATLPAEKLLEGLACRGPIRWRNGGDLSSGR